MKNLRAILIVNFLPFYLAALSQAVVVTDVPGYTVGHASSMLDIHSTTKGLLIPRVTLTSSLASASPVTSPEIGLLVYNEGAIQPLGFYYWNGSAWTSMAGAVSADGSETKVNAGTSMNVSGSGTTLIPYVINYATQTVTYVQRGDLTPSTSQMIICSDCGSSGELQVWNGTTWTNITGGAASAPGPPSIGSAYQGGIVAYIYQPGDPGYIAGQSHGIIAAPSDQGSTVYWGCAGTGITGAAGTALGTGAQNTIDIVAGCAEAGIAARLCSDLVIGIYSDWSLPSQDELNKLYLNQALIGGFTAWYYWSSTQRNTGFSYDQYFVDGQQFSVNKLNQLYVRAIRYF